MKPTHHLPTVHIMLEIQPATYQDQAVLTPALRKVQPYVTSNDACEAERFKYPVREVEEFPGRDVYIPYHNYKLELHSLP